MSWKGMMCAATVLAVLGAPLSAQTGGTLESGIERLAEQIVARSAAADRTTIAIAAFPHVDDTCSELSNFLVDELVLSLFGVPGSQLSIIERSQLSRMFAELELSMSGAVDANTTRELGRVHGVETLLVGSLTTIGDDLRVNARLINTEAGQVFSAAAVNIPRTSTIEELMRRPAAGGCTMMPSGAGSRAEAPSAAARTSAGRPVMPSIEIALPEIASDFEMSMLVGNWSGQIQCGTKTLDRAFELYNPSPVGLQVSYWHMERVASSHVHCGNSRSCSQHTLTFDMRGGSLANKFILNASEAQIALSLISPEVFHGNAKINEEEPCSVFFGKYQ